MQEKVSEDPIINALKKQCFCNVNFEGGLTTDKKNGFRENLAFEKLKKLVHSGETALKYRDLIRESLEAIIMGAQVVSKPQNSLILNILALDIINLLGTPSLRDRCTALIL